MAARYPLSIRFKGPKIKISISNRTEVTEVDPSENSQVVSRFYILKRILTLVDHGNNEQQ